jgi:hypothetical protein
VQHHDSGCTGWESLCEIGIDVNDLQQNYQDLCYAVDIM